MAKLLDEVECGTAEVAIAAISITANREQIPVFACLLLERAANYGLEAVVLHLILRLVSCFEFREI